MNLKEWADELDIYSCETRIDYDGSGNPLYFAYEFYGVVLLAYLHTDEIGNVWFNDKDDGSSIYLRNVDENGKIVYNAIDDDGQPIF